MIQDIDVVGGIACFTLFTLAFLKTYTLLLWEVVSVQPQQEYMLLQFEHERPQSDVCEPL